MKRMEDSLEHQHKDICGCGHDHHDHKHDECGCGHDHHDHRHDECGCGHDHHDHDHDLHNSAAAELPDDGHEKKVYVLENLGCANCAAKMEKKSRNSQVCLQPALRSRQNNCEYLQTVRPH